MLKRKQRLSRKEFSQVLKTGKRVHNSHMTLVHAMGAGVKCGLVVSKKTAKRAVMRNLLRRRIYSILEKNLENLEKKHIIVLTKNNATQLSYPELTEQLELLIAKL